MADFHFGNPSIENPAGCPNPAGFQSVVTEELQSFFRQDSTRAAFCRSEYNRCQDTPAPFRHNWQAMHHYQEAQSALSPAAQRWKVFEAKVIDRFSDFCRDDGCYQKPAIKGWYLDSLVSTVKPRSQDEALTKQPEQQQPQERTWRLDQMELAPGKGRER